MSCAHLSQVFANSQSGFSVPETANIHLHDVYAALECARVEYDIADANLSNAIANLKEALADSVSGGIDQPPP